MACASCIGRDCLVGRRQLPVVVTAFCSGYNYIQDRAECIKKTQVMLLYTASGYTASVFKDFL